MDTHNASFAGLQEAVRRAGSQAALARLLGKKQPHIYKWLNSRHPLRPEHCRAIEIAVGVKRQELRPDDWQTIWPELREGEHA